MSLPQQRLILKVLKDEFGSNGNCNGMGRFIVFPHGDLFKIVMESDSVPLVQEGDVVKVHWDEESSGKYLVIRVKKRKSEKKDSHYTYTLQNVDNAEDIVKTGLAHLRFKVKSKGSSKRHREETVPAVVTPSSQSPSTTRRLPDHSLILAPMVGGSELAFRLLCRKYGATLAYTPMMSSERFAVDADYRTEQFQTHELDRPLVAHFSANNPAVLLAAVTHIEHRCDAIGKMLISLDCIVTIFFLTNRFESWMPPTSRPRRPLRLLSTGRQGP